MTATTRNRMEGKPRDSRGLPIPYVQFLYADGTPDFRTIDEAKLARALRFRLCGLCGEGMGRHVHFVGGPKCVEFGHFYDPPMHRSCAELALRTCPHLARSKGKYADTNPRGDLGETKLVVGKVDPEKCEWFALMHTTAYSYRHEKNGMMIIRAKLPWLNIERWQDGAKITEGTTP